jgi:hypothetical protein
MDVQRQINRRSAIAIATIPRSSLRGAKRRSNPAACRIFWIASLRSQ